MLASLGTELIIILILTLANGFFSGSEIALVSARRSRLEAQAGAGNRAARQALALAANPDRFLATLQVGISLIGTFAAAFGGARIGDKIMLGDFALEVIDMDGRRIDKVLIQHHVPMQDDRELDAQDSSTGS